MPSKTTATSLSEQLRAYVEDLRSRASKLIAERISLTERQKELHIMALCRDDMKTYVLSIIDARARGFEERVVGFAGQIRKATYPLRQSAVCEAPAGLADFDRLQGGDFSVFGSFGMPQFVVPEWNGLALEAALCFYFGDVIKAKLADVFDRTYAGLDKQDEERSGPSIARRREELRNIEARLVEIAAELAAIDADLASVSVPAVDHEAERRAQAEKAKAELAFKRQVLAAWNGRNQDDVAKDFRISPQEVLVIVNSPAAMNNFDRA